jgi:hypothetical protein
MIDGSNPSAIDYVADELKRRVVAKVESHCQDNAFLRGPVDKFSRRFYGVRQRLLAQNMQAALNRTEAGLDVQVNRRRNDDRVHGNVEEFVERCAHAGATARSGTVRRLSRDVKNGDERRLVALLDRKCAQLAYLSGTNQSKAHAVELGFSLLRLIG